MGYIKFSERLGPYLKRILLPVIATNHKALYI